MMSITLIVAVSAIAIIVILGKILTELENINDAGCIKLNVNIDVKKLAHDLANELAEQEQKGGEG